ncbi:ribosomal protein S18-alanine N-acetyltransferase [Glaciecola sp. XM2]|jgi:ribosomal-protein-alanine N-acetyltransferase|uniref:ribosomal protein S18-alanine N-acetyltransferase n=1 Tax=Glaciecola sp. XM2 TaxID=1914931 RepID=UPI001BDF52C0|nr:ribosomal protein S18-alanine N-acetyltransferase [Glaciecola sp. XM2]MBT1450894.1 ribosomal protein S18-alanine N-acetyltransferase [Glaciecola sp. XM2]
MQQTSLDDIQIADPKPEYLEEAYQLFCSHRTVPWSFELFTQSIITPFSLAAVIDGQVVGYVIVSQRPGEAEIEDICVSEAFREQGIGSMMLKEVLARLTRANIDTVYLEVRQSNLSAQRLYRNFGFSFTGERKKYYKNSDGSHESAMLYQWLGGR